MTVEQIIKSVRVIWFPPIFWLVWLIDGFNLYDGMVISKRKIFVRSKSDKKMFSLFLYAIRQKRDRWHQLTGRHFFLHELDHVFLSYETSFWHRIKAVFSGLRKKHDDRGYEERADEFANQSIRLSPKELYEYLVSKYEK